jgi:hypothetical protein
VVAQGYARDHEGMSDDQARHPETDPKGRAPAGEVDRSHGKDERRYVPSDVDPQRWVKRLVWGLVAIAAAYGLALVAAAFFPRWWAQRVADQVNGDLTSGILWGLFYGFVFTLVPLLLVTQLRRRFLSWTWRGILLVVAVLLAIPNWFTLAIVVGNGNAAHAGERILDVDAPGFRIATAIGAVGAAGLVVVLLFTGVVASHRRKQVRDLKGRLDERDSAAGDASGRS